MSWNSKNRSFNLFLLVVITLFILLAGRCFYLVIENKLNLSKEYQDPEIAKEVVRGNITDRKGNILAIQTKQSALYIKKNKTDDLNEVAVILSPTLGMETSEILKRCDMYTYTALIKRHIDSGTSAKLKELIKEYSLEDKVIVEEYEGRMYPSTFHLSQIIGFVNTENKGLEGLEYSLDDILLPYPQLDEKITYGSDVTLTIDLDIQYLVDVAVQDIVYEHSPDYVMAMVMSAKTGEILAASSYPWFDPNYYSTSTEEERLSRTVAYTYEPGSVFKIFTLANAMDQGVDTTTPFICDGEETFTVDGQSFTITCHEKHGEVDAKAMIEKSCNGAIAYWTLQTDKNEFYNYLKSLGFGSKYDISLPSVTKGSLRDVKAWSARSQATLAFGQELSVNALQICTAATAIANDGTLTYPSIIKEIKSHEGKVIQSNKELIQKSVIKEETSRLIREYMKSAVENGTAVKAAVPSISVGAKTGTAEIINPISKSYIDGTSLASTLALAPAEESEYIIYFAVSAPRGDSIWGANVAAPSCAKVIKGLLAQGKLKSESQSILTLN